MTYPLAGRDLAGQAAVLGLSIRERAELAGRDRRILDDAALATQHGVDRLREWLAAGRPEGGFADLVFVGADSVRRLLRDTIAALPAPARWHALVHVSWFEVGRSEMGWRRIAPPVRPHLIALCGLLADDELAHVIAHELAHAILHGVPRPDAAPTVPISREERYGPAVEVAAGDPHLLDIIARPEYQREIQADNLAEVWGFRPRDRTHTSGHHRFRRIREELAAINPSSKEQ